MMYSTYKLNKQTGSIQPWQIPLAVLNHSVVPCLVLSITCWTVYRFLRRQARWSGITISWRIFHNLFSSTQSKALTKSRKQRQVFFFLLEFCFYYDQTGVGNFNSGSSVFSKFSLNIWKFTLFQGSKYLVVYFFDEYVKDEQYQIYFSKFWPYIFGYSSERDNLYITMSGMYKCSEGVC